MILLVLEMVIFIVIGLSASFIGLFAWLHHEQERARWDRWVR